MVFIFHLQHPAGTLTTPDRVIYFMEQINEQQPTRSIHELLQVMLDNFNKYFKSGLCYLTSELFWEFVISIKERSILYTYLSLSLPKVKKDGYCWPCCEYKPRIEWLKKHIELTKPKA